MSLSKVHSLLSSLNPQMIKHVCKLLEPGKGILIVQGGQSDIFETERKVVSSVGGQRL